MHDPLSATSAVPSLAIRNTAPRSRLTTLVRLIIAIPWYLVAALWGIASFVCVIVAWFVLLFTARYPAGLYSFVAGYARFNTRTYAFAFLLVDPLPPFDGAEHPEYPAVLRLGPPLASYSRLKVLLRIFYIIPAYVIGIIAGIALEVVGFISWLVILVLGRQPEGLQNILREALGWQIRYLLLITLVTETYSLEVV
ncbi:MAG TPA: DUF4389 domain-containing protein [Solirubrobacteraceae bacterium]